METKQYEKEKKTIIVKSNVLAISGSLIALLLGSAYATGQEVIQYFSSYGWYGILGVVIFSFLLIFASTSFISAGYVEDFDNANDIFRYYTGNKIGTIFDVFTVLFNYLSFTVMIAGASATGMQQYHWPVWIGGVIMGVCVIAVVLFGLENILSIVGKIGPVIIFLTILTSIIAIFMHFGNLSTAQEVTTKMVSQGKVQRIAPHFLLAVASDLGFCMLFLAPFLANVGNFGNSRSEVRHGTKLGSVIYSIATLLMAFSLFLAMESVAGSQIPNLVLSSKIHPLFGMMFSVIIMIGIFTTAVPLLHNVISRFFDDGTIKFKLSTLILGVIGVVIGLFLRFDTLVSYFYGISGFIGFALIFFMLYKSIDKRIKYANGIKDFFKNR